MRRFRFPLQTVLAVRAARVDEAEAALAERTQICRDLRERLLRLREAEARTLTEMAIGQAGAQSAPLTLQARHAYLLSLKKQFKALETTLATEQTEVVRLRQVLIERSKEEEVIKHLKQRKLKTFRGEVAKEQQAEIDEVAGGRRALHIFRGFES